MREVDAMIQTCISTPGVAARQGLSDMLRALEKYELGDAVQAESTGPALLRQVAELADQYRLPPSVELLWYAHVLEPRMRRPTTTGEAGRRFRDAQATTSAAAADETNKYPNSGDDQTAPETRPWSAARRRDTGRLALFAELQKRSADVTTPPEDKP